MICRVLGCQRWCFRIIGPVPLCLDHLQDVAAALRQPLDTLPQPEPEPPRKTLPTPEPALPPPPKRILDYAGTSYVYYCIRQGQPYIKIGVSQNVHMRMKTHSTMLRPVHLLAVEPGGYYQEKQRHRQFSHLRDGDSEWFRDSPELRAHIQDIRRDHGQASCMCPCAPTRCGNSIRKHDWNTKTYSH